MYNYFNNFQPLLLGAPLSLGALSTRLVRLWVNPALLTRPTAIFNHAILHLNVEKTFTRHKFRIGILIS